MDYLIVAFLTLLTPFTLSMSDIDYTTGLGVKVSDSTESGPFSNKLSAKAIKTGTKSDYEIQKVQHYGPYGVFFDLSVEYQIYPFLNKKNYLKNVWIAPKFSYEPLRDSALITMRSQSSSRPQAIPIMFNQHPSFGFNIGYDAYQFKKGGEIITPYFGMQFMRVGFEGESNFDMQELFDSSIQYTFGLAYRMDQNWAANIELANTFVDVRAVEGENQDFTLQVTRIKLGVTYYLDNSIARQKENKDNTYSDILNSIDPTLKKKIQEKKEIDEANRRAESEAEKARIKEEKEQQKREEENLKAKEEEMKKAATPSAEVAPPAKAQAQPKAQQQNRSRLFNKAQ